MKVKSEKDLKAKIKKIFQKKCFLFLAFNFNCMIVHIVHKSLRTSN